MRGLPEPPQPSTTPRSLSSRTYRSTQNPLQNTQQQHQQEAGNTYHSSMQESVYLPFQPH
jgi:hypothetical protein